MAIENESLVLDLLEWISDRPRTYAETMDAWKTSCPRLTIWEDAVDLKLVSRANRGGAGLTVGVTAAGREFLAGLRPALQKA